MSIYVAIESGFNSANSIDADQFDLDHYLVMVDQDISL